MAKARIEFAAVVGSGVFPFDMLRYDFCSPASESADCSVLGRMADPTIDDDSKLKEYLRLRVVTVKRIVAPDVVGGYWTPARWSSFGWRLIVGEGKRGFEYEDEARAAGERYVAATPRGVRG